MVKLVSTSKTRFTVAVTIVNGVTNFHILSLRGPALRDRNLAEMIGSSREFTNNSGGVGL